MTERILTLPQQAIKTSAWLLRGGALCEIESLAEDVRIVSASKLRLLLSEAQESQRKTACQLIDAVHRHEAE